MRNDVDYTDYGKKDDKIQTSTLKSRAVLARGIYRY